MSSGSTVKVILVATLEPVGYPDFARYARPWIELARGKAVDLGRLYHRRRLSGHH